MKEKIQSLRQQVVKAASRQEFIHYNWFVKYHLEIVHQISMELCSIYPDANSNLVECIVWLHDYGKILDFDRQEEMLFQNGEKLMQELGFGQNMIGLVMNYLRIFEQKMEIDLNEAPIEVRIVSSADAASHFYGPFFFLWWYENPNKDYEELMADNAEKAQKDWERKIVIPEVKDMVRDRYKYLLEKTGQLPRRYISESDD